MAHLYGQVGHRRKINNGNLAGKPWRACLKGRNRRTALVVQPISSEPKCPFCRVRWFRRNINRIGFLDLRIRLRPGSSVGALLRNQDACRKRNAAANLILEVYRQIETGDGR